MDDRMDDATVTLYLSVADCRRLAKALDRYGDCLDASPETARVRDYIIAKAAARIRQG